MELASRFGVWANGDYPFPNLLRARLSANEATAIAAMRTLSTAYESYRAAQSPPAYPSALTDLNASNPPYIDSVLAGGNKSGYSFAPAGGVGVG